MTKTGAFLLGMVAGGAVVTIARTAAFRKACAKVVGAGMMLKEDARAFSETIKEDAEDVMAETKYNRSQKAESGKPAAAPAKA